VIAMRREFVQASCEGKERLPTWKLARERANKMSKHYKADGMTFEPYRCKACGGIHIGSQDIVSRRGKYFRKRTPQPDDPGYPGHEQEVVY
jgi:hypothetical protein